MDDHILGPCADLKMQRAMHARRGHIARVCQAAMRQKSQKAHCVKDSEISENSSEDEVYAMFAVRDPATNPIYKEVHINRVYL